MRWNNDPFSVLPTQNIFMKTIPFFELSFIITREIKSSKKRMNENTKSNFDISFFYRIRTKNK